MRFVSAYFGAFEVEEGAVIEFPEGLPGFEERRRFLPLQHGPPGGLVFLQSLEIAELCFLALPVQVLRPEYQVCMTAEDQALLGLKRPPLIGQNVAALAVVSVAEGQEPTVNLRSPIVIRIDGGRAVQAIRPDERYQCREPLAPLSAGAVC